MKSSRDTILLRQKAILQMLQKSQDINVGELSRQFGVTTATIRRDLEVLEEQGSIKR